MPRSAFKNAASSRAAGESASHAPISAVSRAMDVLERLALATEGVAVSDLSRELDVDKSVISRILASLARDGYVQKDLSSDRYHLTFKISALAHTHLGSAGFPERCVPILKELAQQTGELVELAVADGDQLWFVARVEGWHRLRVAPYGGGPIKLHATATGKAWLASLPDSEALRIAKTQGLTPVLEATITSPDALAAELALIRGRGYATSREEIMEGTSSIGVAIPSPFDTDIAVGALVVVGPTFRLTDEALTRLAPSVQSCAQALSYAWPLTASATGPERSE